MFIILPEKRTAGQWDLAMFASTTRLSITLRVRLIGSASHGRVRYEENYRSHPRDSGGDLPSYYCAHHRAHLGPQGEGAHQHDSRSQLRAATGRGYSGDPRGEVLSYGSSHGARRGGRD